MRIGIVGATGAVGRQMITCLEERKKRGGSIMQIVNQPVRKKDAMQLVTGQRQGQQEHQTEVQLQIVYQKLHGSLSCESG